MNAYRTGWNVVAGILLATGMALAVMRVGFGEVLAIGLPLGGIAGLYAFLYAPPGEALIGWVAGWTALVACTLPALVGLLSAFGGVGLLAVLVFGAGAPPLLSWVAGRSWVSQRVGGLARTQVATRISDRDLVLAWQSSYTAMQTTRDVATLARIVQVRRLLLDELERRSLPSAHGWVAAPDQIVATRNRQGIP